MGAVADVGDDAVALQAGVGDEQSIPLCQIP